MTVARNLYIKDDDALVFDLFCDCGGRVLAFWVKRSDGFLSESGECDMCKKGCAAQAVRNEDGTWEFEILK